MAKTPGNFRWIDKDLGWKALRAEVHKLAMAAGGSRVIVGIREENGSAMHGEGPATVAEIGSFHEFGTAKIPQRSFIRDTVDQNQKEIGDTAGKLALSVIDRKRSGEQALALLGAQVVGMIQKRINQGIPPPLKPATIQAKGSSTPLIDTGQLKGSIDYEVKK